MCSYPVARSGSSFVHRLESAETINRPKNDAICRDIAVTLPRILTVLGDFLQGTILART